MSSDKIPQVAAAVFVLKGEKVLVGKRLAGAGTSCFSVPSGHLEFGEVFEECAAREVKEEAGLELKNIETLKVINHVFHNEAKPSHYVVLLIQAKLSDPDQILENVDQTGARVGIGMSGTICQSHLLLHLKSFSNLGSIPSSPTSKINVS